jgi:hypothetical protein
VYKISQMAESLPKAQPIETIRTNISAIEVAKYYLSTEFSKMFPDLPTKEMEATIQKLSDSNIWALLEAISFTYRLNGVFYNISRTNYTWNEEVWHVKDLVMTGMDSNVNKIIFSEEIKGDAIKFRNYLLNYFEKNPSEDPEGLFSYKPKKVEIKLKKLLMKEQGGKVLMLDGSHRLVEMLLSSAENVTAYVGHPNTKEAEEHPKGLIGDSTFIMLTIMYKNGNQEERNAVMTLLKELIQNSLDGKTATQKYWIDRMRDEEIKQAGMAVLQEFE